MNSSIEDIRKGKSAFESTSVLSSVLNEGSEELNMLKQKHADGNEDIA